MIQHKKLADIISELPIRTYSFRGRSSEPVNLIILGSKRQIQENFIKNGWYPAVGLNLRSALHGIVAALVNLSFPTGPVGTLYINRKPQLLAFQKPTKSNTFRRRHHLRLWKVNFRIGTSQVWIGMLSYDRSAGHYKNSLMPTHHISPSLISEENYLADTFQIKNPVFIKLSEPENGSTSNGDHYYWDGRALLIDLSP